MTILFSSLAPVKTSRRFGRGILPPSAPTFEPSAADRAWWASESDRIEQARCDYGAFMACCDELGHLATENEFEAWLTRGEHHYPTLAEYATWEADRDQWLTTLSADRRAVYHAAMGTKGGAA